MTAVQAVFQNSVWYYREVRKQNKKPKVKHKQTSLCQYTNYQMPEYLYTLYIDRWVGLFFVYGNIQEKVQPYSKHHHHHLVCFDF